MAKVKIQGNASGTGILTVTAPNTNTDRTITLPDSTGTLVETSTTDALTTRVNGVGGRKNLIINGAMNVAQRGTSNAAFGAGYLVADRFRFGNNGSYGNQSQYTVTQDSNAPDGFAYSMKLSVGADIAAPSSTQASFMEQIFEKTNVDCLAYGTSSAKSVTLSFWVKSSLTGQFGVALAINSTISNSRNYTISSANTWEKKTLTFTGNTSTAISGDTFKLKFAQSFGATLAQSGGDSWVSGTYYGASGNVNLGDTQNATWQITGVQLELGSTATDFEHRSYGEELALCQRYFERFDYDKSGGGVSGIAGQCHDASIMYCALVYQPKRVDPTVSTSTVSGSNFRVLHSGTATNITSFAFNASRNCTRIGATTGSGLTLGRAGILDTGSSQGQYIDIDAEL